MELHFDKGASSSQELKIMKYEQVVKLVAP